MVSNNRDSVPNAVIPNPDPSLITAQAIDRAVDNSKAIVDTRIDGMEKAVAVFQADLTRVPTTLDRAVQSLRELIETRLDGMDRDMGGIHHTVDQRGADIREQIEHLKELAFGKIEELASVTKEKFEGVAAQFSERDTRTDQRAGDTKLAVDAAFAAAKEATSKIEAGFTKSIDGQQELLKTTTKATDDKISDLKDRLTAIENRTSGITAANSDNRNASNDSTGRMLSMVAIIVSVAAVVAMFALHMH